MSLHRTRAEDDHDLGVPIGTTRHLELPPRRSSRPPSGDGYDQRGLSIEPGLPVEPESLGVQFLRGATEQDHFEADVLPEWDSEIDVSNSVVSEATLGAALFDSDEDEMPSSVPASQAFGDERGARGGEPYAVEVDLHSTAIHEASLFDQPVLDDEPSTDEDEEHATRWARVAADDQDGYDARRARAIKRRCEALLAERIRKEGPPSRRG